MDKEKMDEIYRENAAMIYKYLCGLTQDSGLTNSGEIVKFPSGYVELQKNYGIRNWKKEAGIKLPRWKIGCPPQKMLKIKALTIWKK